MSIHMEGESSRRREFVELQRARELLRVQLDVVDLKIENASLKDTVQQLKDLVEHERRAHPSMNYRDQASQEGQKIFIGHGHSLVWRELESHLREQHGLEVVHFGSAPRAGISVVEVLQEMIEEASIAVLVHAAEDETAAGALRARQNVVHETGLLQGRLGLRRAIILREDGCEPFSNLAGVQELRFGINNIREIFGDVVATIKRELG